jgi:hypothetical protein
MNELIDARDQICITSYLVTCCRSLYLLELARVQSRPLYQRRDGVACNASQALPRSLDTIVPSAACYSLPEIDLREVAMVCVNGRKPPEQLCRGCYGECGGLKCASPGKLLTRHYFPIQKALPTQSRRSHGDV